MKLSAVLLKSTVVASLGRAGTTRALTAAYGPSPSSLGLTVASALWGTVLGALLAGIPGDRYGRRDSLRGLAVLYLVSALGCAFAWGWYSVVFFCFVAGLGIGGSSVLGPMYIAEIAPARWRGCLVGFFQFNVVAGILLAYFSNYLIGLTEFGDLEWRWKLGVSAIPAFLFLLMLFGISPSGTELWLGFRLLGNAATHSTTATTVLNSLEEDISGAAPDLIETQIPSFFSRVEERRGY